MHVHARSTIGLLFFFFSRLDNEPTVEKANSIMMREQIARINGVKRARARAVNARVSKKDAQPVLNEIDETVKNSPCFFAD